MKTSNIIPIIIILLLSTSCQKYLDVKKSSSLIFISSAEDCQLLLDNYGVMNTGYPTDQETSCDDYYLTNNDYTSQGSEDQGIYDWSATVIRSSASPQWQNPYFIVYNADLVLEAVDKLKGSSTDLATLNSLRGAALFYRSYAFWQVSQLYAKPYVASTANQDAGIPLRLSSDINGVSTRGTVQQTYNQMIQDLQEAVTLLPPTATVASRPSKSAAYAMLSRIYLSMDNYADALTNASSALAINNQLMDFNTLNTNTDYPFARFNKEVLFHSIIAGSGATITSAFYAKIDTDLVASYQDNDLRKAIYLKDYGDGTIYFSGSYEPNTYTNWFNGLAVDEIYLNRAECYARAGNTTAAMADLNTLLKTRWKTGLYIDMSANSQDDALSKILIERRKELLMRSTRWTDLRRLNKDSRFAVTLQRVINGKFYTLPPNDLRYTLLIPDAVIKNSSIAQNPR